MSKIELDDQFLDHPKFVRAVKLAGSDAIFLWMGIRSYCSKLLTDGFIPSDMVDEVRGPRDQKRRSAALEALRTVNLLEDTEGGYRLHDYLDHASSRDQIMAWRKANADRKAKSRGVSRRDYHRDGERDTSVTPPVTDGVTTSGVPAPSPSPSPSQTQSSSQTQSQSLTVTSPEPPRLPSRVDRAKSDLAALPIADLARRCRENPHDGGFASPQDRPEVKQVNESWCRAVGLAVRPLGYLSERNKPLRTILEALETYPLEDILRACSQAAHDPWCRGEVPERDGSPGRKHGVENMTPTVLRRLLDAADAARSSSGSSAVAKMLAEEERKRSGAHP